MSENQPCSLAPPLAGTTWPLQPTCPGVPGPSALDSEAALFSREITDSPGGQHCCPEQPVSRHWKDPEYGQTSEVRGQRSFTGAAGSHLCIVLPRPRPRNLGEKLQVLQELRPGASQIVPQRHTERAIVGGDTFVLSGATGYYSVLRRATSLTSHIMQGWEKLLLERRSSNTCMSDATVSRAGRLRETEGGS